MKIALNKLRRDEKGQAFILVLILLLVGGLIITPLLSYMSTGLKVGQMHEERMAELYAADAGVEDALWQISNNAAGLPEYGDPPWVYPLADVNDKGVEVNITLEEDVEQFLEGLLGEDSGPHELWTVVGAIPGADTYTITVTYLGNAAKKFIRVVGAWMEGTRYEVGSASGMTGDYPVFTSSLESYKGGTAFFWGWTGANRPEFGLESGVFTRTLTFEFGPVGEPVLYVSFLIVGSMDIGAVSGGQTFGIWKVTATATDSITLKQTEVTTYVASQGEVAPYPVRIVTWEVNLQ